MQTKGARSTPLMGNGVNEFPWLEDKRAITEIYIQQGWKKAYTSETSPSSCVIHANP